MFPQRCKVSYQEVPNTNGSMISTSIVHHEFDMICCYNSNGSDEYMNFINHIASLRRIDNTRHLICIHNIHIMKDIHLTSLNLMIEAYSDRSMFVLTTTRISSIPRKIQSQCVLLRCPCNHLFDVQATEVKNKIRQVIQRPSDLDKARELAYTFVTFNIAYTFFAKLVLEIMTEENKSEECMHTIVSILANNETCISHTKKSVMVWEMTLFQLMMLHEESK